MAIPIIKSATIDFGSSSGGTFVLREGGTISGTPFPSEGEAWAFGEGIKILNRFIFTPHDKQQAILEESKLWVK